MANRDDQPAGSSTEWAEARREDNPLREFHQEGDAHSDRPIDSLLATSCGSDGRTGSRGHLGAGRKNKTGVERIVVLHGGIGGAAPESPGSMKVFLEEREEISRGIAVGGSIRQIAQGLGRAPSTVSREIRRNGGSQAYRANRADRRARERALRPKPCRLALYSALRWRVAQSLRRNGRRSRFPAWRSRSSQPTKTCRYLTKRSIAASSSRPAPRSCRRSCVLRGGCVTPRATTRRVDRGISSIWSLSASGPPRLRIALCRHRKGDLLTGANDTHIATLVERNTRFTMLVSIPRKDTTTVVAALAKHISKLPEELRRSLTWDQGKEMHAHKRFTVATNVQVYFCDPRSPWQRGSNENTIAVPGAVAITLAACLRRLVARPIG